MTPTAQTKQSLAALKQSTEETAPSVDRADAYKNRGNAYLFNNKFDNAIADFTAAIRLRPDADLYTSRGAAFYQKGDTDHAKADWAEAKRLKEPGKSKP